MPTTRKRAAKLVPQAVKLGRAQMASRVVNVAPWEPLPGMEKRQCPECRYLFAAPVDVEELRCPDCVAAGTRWLGATAGSGGRR